MEPETVHVPSPWTKSATPCVISSGSSDVLSDQRWKSRPDLVFSAVDTNGYHKVLFCPNPSARGRISLYYEGLSAEP